MNVTAKKKISRKLLLGLSIFALVLFLFTALFVGYYYYNVKMREYRDTSNAYAKVAADFIDGDRVLAYVEPVGTDADGQPVYEKDDYYDTVMAFLNASQSMVDLMRYYYVFVPYEDDLVYVWDANTAEDYAELGYREEYMDGGKEAVERIYRADPEEEITVFEDETYGHIACAYYPILDSEGNFHGGDRADAVSLYTDDGCCDYPGNAGGCGNLLLYHTAVSGAPHCGAE